MKKTKCANRGLNTKWPKLEVDVFKWIEKALKLIQKLFKYTVVS